MNQNIIYKINRFGHSFIEAGIFEWMNVCDHPVVSNALKLNIGYNRLPHPKPIAESAERVFIQFIKDLNFAVKPVSLVGECMEYILTQKLEVTQVIFGSTKSFHIYQDKVIVATIEEQSLAELVVSKKHIEETAKELQSEKSKLLDLIKRIKEDLESGILDNIGFQKSYIEKCRTIISQTSSL